MQSGWAGGCDGGGDGGGGDGGGDGGTQHNVHVPGHKCSTELQNIPILYSVSQVAEPEHLPACAQAVSVLVSNAFGDCWKKRY